jgi:N-acetylmuramoyl-L-alanine amidase
MQLENLIIHCTATPEGKNVIADEIRQWHLGPSDRGGGLVRYKGKIIYKNNLPNEEIGGVSVKTLRGRGWSRVGYSDLIMLDGTLINLTPFDQNDEVDYNEMTWGVQGLNGVSRHIVYAGGCDKKMNPKDTRTLAQRNTLKTYVEYTVLRHPNIKIAGHNNFAAKACPSFVVSDWLEQISIKEKNIYRNDPDNTI